MESANQDQFEDAGEVETVFIMAVTKITQNYFVRDDYPRLKKILKYLIGKFVEINSEDSNSSNEEFYNGMGIEQSLDIIESIISLVECGDQ